jgi:hypothetical protein
MPMRRLRKRWIAAVVVAIDLLVGAGLVCAQDQQPEDASKPKPAARAYPPVGYPDQNPNGEQDSTLPLQPDTRPLTGVQDPTLGSPELGHSFWVPGVQYHNIAGSTALNQTSASGWNSTSYLVGNISLLKASSNSQLSVNYSGGGYFSTNSVEGNGQFHQLALVQAFKWRRWQLSLIDQFSYLPESSFGFGLGTGISIPGIGGSLGSVLSGLQGTYQPNQSILTSIGARYNNSFTTQVVYALNRRSSINVAGSYGILRFVKAGNIDSDDVIANVGYNYLLSKKDTIGVLYRFSEYRYIGNPQVLDDHAVHAAYGRKITGRLALQLLGGPEITTFRIPVRGQTRRVSPSGSATLSYAWGANNLSLTYSHGVSNGGGAQVGANSDQVQTGLDRQISRYWHGNINFGYARNEGFGNFSGLSQNAQVFDSYYVGGGLGRPLGRNSTLLLGYTARIQTSNQAVCAAGTCSTSYTQHQVSVGFSWHARPFGL